MVEVEDKTSTMWKISYTYHLPYPSMPQQVQVNKLLVNIINKI